MEPEDLVKDFLSVNCIKISHISTDNEFTVFTEFKAFCKANNIRCKPSAAYMHTMQELAEGALHICKDHVCCSLRVKSSNAQARCLQGSGCLHCYTSAEHTIIGLGLTHLSHGKICSTPTLTLTWSVISTHGAAMSLGNCPKNTLSSVNTTHANRGV
eukprot:589216-Rhodomonas_salina.1